MKRIDYCVYREEEFFVAQCLNVDVSSFGHSRDEAVANLKEAVELYFQGETNAPWEPVSEVSVGQELIHA
jgi:predicted RNase H-like HicB family nuclease